MRETLPIFTALALACAEPEPTGGMDVDEIATNIAELLAPPPCTDTWDLPQDSTQEEIAQALAQLETEWEENWPDKHVVHIHDDETQSTKPIIMATNSGDYLAALTNHHPKTCKANDTCFATVTVNGTSLRPPQTRMAPSLFIENMTGSQFWISAKDHSITRTFMGTNNTTQTPEARILHYDYSQVPPLCTP